ncbi:hypothetical protein CBR_g20376 [Chara braunii]|uniref:Uncharacterized protein n=1 Tax=Chara braunii TaxID=69332 RepID=A0A388JUF0_CHABU|nr:hypothetical protein CBR_g20376 [Chara braunii]|eukprot:GBG61342.1 hypothetical protein CBR_g20376 [Chara braunii]
MATLRYSSCSPPKPLSHFCRVVPVQDPVDVIIFISLSSPSPSSSSAAAAEAGEAAAAAGGEEEFLDCLYIHIYRYTQHSMLLSQSMEAVDLLQSMGHHSGFAGMENPLLDNISASPGSERHFTPWDMALWEREMMKLASQGASVEGSIGCKSPIGPMCAMGTMHPMEVLGPATLVNQQAYETFRDRLSMDGCQMATETSMGFRGCLEDGVGAGPEMDIRSPPASEGHEALERWLARPSSMTVGSHSFPCAAQVSDAAGMSSAIPFLASDLKNHDLNTKLMWARNAAAEYGSDHHGQFVATARALSGLLQYGDDDRGNGYSSRSSDKRKPLVMKSMNSEYANQVAEEAECPNQAHSCTSRWSQESTLHHLPILPMNMNELALVVAGKHTHWLTDENAKVKQFLRMDSPLFAEDGECDSAETDESSSIAMRPLRAADNKAVLTTTTTLPCEPGNPRQNPLACSPLSDRRCSNESLMCALANESLARVLTSDGLIVGQRRGQSPLQDPSMTIASILMNRGLAAHPASVCGPDVSAFLTKSPPTASANPQCQLRKGQEKRREQQRPCERHEQRIDIAAPCRSQIESGQLNAGSMLPLEVLGPPISYGDPAPLQVLEKNYKSCEDTIATSLTMDRIPSAGAHQSTRASSGNESGQESIISTTSLSPFSVIDDDPTCIEGRTTLQDINRHIQNKRKFDAMFPQKDAEECSVTESAAAAAKMARSLSMESIRSVQPSIAQTQNREEIATVSMPRSLSLGNGAVQEQNQGNTLSGGIINCSSSGSNSTNGGLLSKNGSFHSKSGKVVVRVTKLLKTRESGSVTLRRTSL